MKIFKRVMLFHFLTLLLLANANADFSNNKKGFWITPKPIPQNEVVVKNGESFLFEGEVCVVKWNFVGHEKCLKIPTSKVVFKAYYPDSLHDVTDQLEIAQSNDMKTWKYKFKTGAVKDVDLNQFTLTVGSNSKNAEDLLKVKAKFEKRILILKGFKNKYAGNTKHKKNIDYLNDLVNYLELLVSRIDLALDNNPEILAQIRQPLQVENKISGPMIYSSNFSGHKLTLKIPVGLPFEGEKATIESSVTNLTDKSFYFPEFVDENDGDPDETITGEQSFRLAIELDNHTLIQTQPFSLGFGQTKTIKVTTPKLNPHSTNKIKTHFEKSSIEKFDFYSFWARRQGSLSYDLNVIEDEVAPELINWKPVANSYHKTLPEIEGTIKDLKGRIDVPTLSVKFKGEKTDQSFVDKELITSFSVSSQDADDNFLIKGNSGVFEEGDYEIIFSGKDFAGNEFTKIIPNIVYDSTAPVIDIQTFDNRLTNQPTFKIFATAFDLNPGQTQILHNGQVIFSTNDVVVDFDAILTEGLNTFEISSVDLAGNVAVKKGLYNVVLDTIPPKLSEIIPSDDSNVYNLNFTSSGKSNEPLMSAKINGKTATLSGDLKSFTTGLTAFVEGDYPIQIVATDKALNFTTVNLNVKIVLKVLNIDLVSIVPDPNNADRLIVIGAPGATRPGAEVRLYGGLFNQKTFISNSGDGSFEAYLEFFNSVEVRAKDLVLNRTETANLSYNVDTTLAGVIKDTDDEPLPGVKVTIVGSGQQATTDATGSFRIPKPATGDQVLSLDGTSIPIVVSGPNKKFARVNIAVSIGTRQSNVLENPIYLAPLMFDGTETVIADTNSSAVVESPHAEGVSLRIPAGVTTFPDGKKIGTINVAEISALYTAVPVLDFAKPQTVYAFEPSGLKFSTPVELTLPNVNEIPPGVQMVIMSKNSEKGIWEIDGLARVTEDGSDIVTEPNSGITHFSEVYAVPLGPQISEFAGTSHPGADMSMGVLQNSIEIPSYKVFGKDLAMNLSYKSIWADPTVTVSNIIDVPRNEYSFSYSGSARTLFAKGSVEVSGKSWIEPDSITASFYTDSLISQNMEFKGVPQKSLISYAMDLSSLPTGLHTYNSHYDIKLKQLIFGTRTTKTKKLFGKTRTSQESFSETRLIDEVFPQDMGGALHIQNYNASKAGRGWRINGAGKIYNLENPRVLIEETDGGTTSYAVNSTIETLYFNSNKTLQSVDLLSWPTMTGYSDYNRDIFFHNFTTNSGGLIGTVDNYSGKFEGYSVGMSDYGIDGESRNGSCVLFCSIEYMSYSRPKNINSVFNLGNNQILTLSAEGGIESFKNAQKSKLSGIFFTPDLDFTWYYGGDPWPTWYCPTYLGTNCYGETKRAFFNKGESYGAGYEAQSCPLPIQSKGTVRDYCKANGYIAQSTGYVGVNGYSDGTNPSYNNLTAAIKGYGDEILLADFGNNRVRALNIVTNIARTLAGNGQTYDNGDGNTAINASLYHPRSLAKDSLGNIYVSTERGFIRKIDPNGFITTFAGKANGNLNDKSHALEMRLNNPFGLIVDTENNFLYVADTGHHRVVRIDLQTKEAVTVAGNGTCQSGNIGDGKAALLASLCNPREIGLDDQSNLLIFDKGHNRVRRVNFDTATNGVIQYQPLAQDNSSLTKQADGTFIRKFRNGSFIKYDSLGRQAYSQDRVGNKFTFGYNTDSSLAFVTDPTNRSTQYQYSNGRLDQIVDPQGRVTEFTYDVDLLTKVRFPDGSERNFEYNSTGLMTTEFDKRGSQTTYSYNQWKRLLKVTRADGSAINFQDGVTATIGNGYVGGQVGTLKSTSKNEVIDGIKDNRGQTTTLNKDENGFVTKMIDPKGDVYTIERDLDGRPTKITRPDETVATFTYESNFHDLVSKSDSLTGVTIYYQYDVFGSLLSQNLPNGETVSFDYDDNSGLLLSKTLPLNTFESYEYFSNGLLKAKINPLGQRTSFVYGSNGNLTTITDNMGQSSQIVRDGSGNILTSTNPKGQVTTYSYDVANRLTSVKSAKNEVTTYEYLPSGELAKVIDPEANETSYEYDGLGRLTKKTDPLGLTNQISYDNNDNVTKEIDSKGHVKLYEYDNHDRLIKKILPDDIYEFTYDERENVKSIRNNLTLLSFDYEQRYKGSVLVKESVKGFGDLSDLPTSVVEYDYDESGNRIEMATSKGNFFYTYDKLNRLTKIINHKSEVFDYTYDHGSRINQQRSPASVTSYQFDNVNFLTNITHKNRSNATVVSSLSYARDQLGNITKMTSLNGDYLFTYDSNNQLINSTHPESEASNFVYDSLGNRTNDQEGNYIYDNKKQRLVEDWQFTYVYDNNGNLTSKVLKSHPSKVTSYNYNSQNQLIALKEFDGTTLLKESQYYYDAIGRRVVKYHVDMNNSSKSFERKYVYDGQSILFELNDNNNYLTIFTYSLLRIDDVLATDKGEISYFYLKNHLGSINEVIDGMGNLVQRYIYSTFGKILKIENASGADITATPMVDNSFAFTGREFDKESGLYYYRARYYDSETGRFIQSDPHPGTKNSPMTFNSKYIYGSNDPLNRIDPMGTFNLRNAISLTAAFVAGFAVGFGAGYILGPTWGPIVGGFLGGAIGGEVAYRTNRILGGSKEESSKLRQSGRIAGAIGGSFGGASGAEYEMTHQSYDLSAAPKVTSVDKVLIMVICTAAAVAVYHFVIDPFIKEKFPSKGNEQKDPESSPEDTTGEETSSNSNTSDSSGGQCG